MNALENIRKKYEKQKRIGRIAGVAFLILAIFFAILGIILGKPQVFIGVSMQIVAGIMLLMNNK